MSVAGDRIKDIRKLLGLSQQALANKIDYSVTSVQKWEYGTRIPRQRAIDAVNSLLEKNRCGE